MIIRGRPFCFSIFADSAVLALDGVGSECPGFSSVIKVSRKHPGCFARI